MTDLVTTGERDPEVSTIIEEKDDDDSGMLGILGWKREAPLVTAE